MWSSEMAVTVSKDDVLLVQIPNVDLSQSSLLSIFILYLQIFLHNSLQIFHAIALFTDWDPACLG